MTSMISDLELLEGVSYMYGGASEENLSYYKVRIVVTRTPHQCNSYYHDQRPIPPGSKAALEHGFLEGRPVTSYTCKECCTRAYKEYRALCRK